MQELVPIFYVWFLSSCNSQQLATAYYISQQSYNPNKVRKLKIQVILWFCIIAELFLVGIICSVLFQYTCTNCSEAGGGLFYTSLRRKTSGNLYRDTRSLSQEETKIWNFPSNWSARWSSCVCCQRVEGGSIPKRENLFGSVVRMMPIASVLKIDRDSTWRSALQGKGNLTEVQSRWWTTFWNCSVLYIHQQRKQVRGPQCVT